MPSAATAAAAAVLWRLQYAPRSSHAPPAHVPAVQAPQARPAPPSSTSLPLRSPASCAPCWSYSWRRCRPPLCGRRRAARRKRHWARWWRWMTPTDTGATAPPRWRLWPCTRACVLPAAALDASGRRRARGCAPWPSLRDVRTFTTGPGCCAVQAHRGPLVGRLPGPAAGRLVAGAHRRRRAGRPAAAPAGGLPQHSGGPAEAPGAPPAGGRRWPGLPGSRRAGGRAGGLPGIGF